jgi:3-phenylpropionate/trans-cinnamate dioxygenase ferredoxin reductase subunit
MAGAVIVGTGIAGTTAAFALREAGYAGSIALIGDEDVPPYERPPLSKAVLLGDGAGPPAIRPEADYAAANIELVTGITVRRLHPSANEVDLSDGSSRGYGRLLLATGAEPRRLRVPGADGPVHYLRSAHDAARLRTAIVPGCSVVIIGGGLIGLEVAAAARQRGAAVTAIEAAPRVLGRGVPQPFAETLAAEHVANGVELMTGAEVAEIAWRGERAELRLVDGRVIPADVVIAAIGIEPRTALAVDTGLAIDNGIAADETLRCSDTTFAAGDCVSFPHPLFGGRRVRLESWHAAEDLGAAAGRSMAGPPQPVAAVPWMWSDQYELGLYLAGLPEGGATTITRHADNGTVSRFSLDEDGRLIGAGALGDLTSGSRDIKLAQRLIAQRAKPDPHALADPNVSLKSLLVREPAAT